MKGTPLVVSLAILLLVTPLPIARATAGQDSSPAEGGDPWVVITITNAEPFPTNADFQQLIHFDSAEYAAYLNENLSNLRFAYDANLTAIPSWIEDNDTTASTNTSIFLNLTWGIPADGSVLVDAIFDPIGTFDWSVSGPAGVFPNATATYGEFDDGAKTFDYYTNFSGHVLPANWFGEYESNGDPWAGFYADDGGTVAPDGGNEFWFWTVEQKASVVLLDFSMVLPVLDDAAEYIGYAANDVPTNSPTPYGMAACASSVCGGEYDGGWLYRSNNLWPQSPSTLGWHTVTLEANTSGCEALTNYTLFANFLVGCGGATTGLYFGGQSFAGSGGTPLIMRWFDTRSPPPANVMPAASFGEVQTSALGNGLPVFSLDPSVSGEWILAMLTLAGLVASMVVYWRLRKGRNGAPAEFV